MTKKNRTKLTLKKKIIFSTIIFLIFLLVVEMFFRITGLRLNQSSVYGIFSNLYAPYVGFINSPNTNGNYGFMNSLKGEMFKGKRSTNNWGYRCDIDYDFVKFYDKKENEKIVLLTGGSAAAGAGASADDTTIDARIQYYLNKFQNKYSYKAFNFGNGGWVAFQEFTGVMLFGKQLDPDWIVTMNGRNDIAVCVDHQEGAAVHMHHHLIKSYINGYLECGRGSTFYRGKLENWLVKHSKAYSGLTGKIYIPKNQCIIEKTSYKLVGKKTTWKDVEDQLEFYVRVQESFLGVSDNCKYILSMQPLVFSYSTLFEDMTLEELKKYAIDTPEKMPKYNFSSLYFYREADKKLKEMRDKYEKTKDIQYTYAGIVFENKQDDGTHFLDEAHMTDPGADKVAKLYALMILRRDFPERKEEFNKELKKLIKIEKYDFKY